MNDAENIKCKWVACNENGEYHLFNEKPHYDNWYNRWVIGNPYKYNDEQTIKYIDSLYEKTTPQEIGFSMNWRDEPIAIYKQIKLKHPNKKRKLRKAIDRPFNKYIENHKYNFRCIGDHCDYFDEIRTRPDGTIYAITECNCPWDQLCMGNKFNCNKLKYRWLASLSNKKRKEYLELHE